MEQLHRNSMGSAVTLDGHRAVLLRSSGLSAVRHPTEGIKNLPSFTFKLNMLSEATTVVWDNPHGIAVLPADLAEALLARNWAKEVTAEAFDWWNAQFASSFAEPDGGADAGKKDNVEPEKDSTPAPASEPAKEEPKASEPAPKAEPVKETPKAPEPAKEAPKPAATKSETKDEPKAEKPAATKEELLKRAEAEAAASKK